MPVTLEDNETFCRIRLEGEIGIPFASELKSVLLQALAGGKDLRVDVRGVTELDVTAYQLLWAVERKASGSGAGFSLAESVPEKISQAMVNAGLEMFPVIPDRK
jgi:anti-anti-sigma regulatory factor